MKKKNYIITGITPEIAKIWNRDFREDVTLLVHKDTGDVHARIALTKFQALKVRLGMVKYNLTHPCVLKLLKEKGKRARV